MCLMPNYHASQRLKALTAERLLQVSVRPYPNTHVANTFIYVPFHMVQFNSHRFCGMPHSSK